MSEDDTSMRDDINAALDITDETGESYEETPQEVYSEREADDPQPLGEDSEADGGKSQSESDETRLSGDAKTDALSDSGKSDGVGDDSSDADAALDKRSLKAPIDWSPKEREDWSRIPRPLQEKVLARESQMAEVMANTRPARETHEQFNELTNRYGAILSGVVEGNTPMEAVSNLFGTVANLRMGSQLQKAQTIASLIESFDVDIASLDSVIVGQVPQENPNAEVERMLNERLAPFEQHQQQLAYQEEQKSQQMYINATNDIKSFMDSGKAEFLNDVRLDMADLIDLGAKRGIALTTEEAYHRACSVHPEISKVLQSRAKSASIAQGNNSVQAKRNAASGLKGSRIGVNSANGSMSLRDQIASAWDNAE